VELLLMDKKLLEEIKQDLEVMANNLEKMKQLINGSLARYKEITEMH